MAHGPATGLALLDGLAADERIANDHRLAAVRAHLLEIPGDHPTGAGRLRGRGARATSQPSSGNLRDKAARLPRYAERLVSESLSAQRILAGQRKWTVAPRIPSVDE